MTERPRFSWRADKDGKLFVFWGGKQVKVLRGREAQSILDKLGRQDEADVQMTLARITGNFKRGNERR